MAALICNSPFKELFKRDAETEEYFRGGIIG